MKWGRRPALYTRGKKRRKWRGWRGRMESRRKENSPTVEPAVRRTNKLPTEEQTPDGGTTARRRNNSPSEEQKNNSPTEKQKIRRRNKSSNLDEKQRKQRLQEFQQSRMKIIITEQRTKIVKNFNTPPQSLFSVAFFIHLLSMLRRLINCSKAGRGSALVRPSATISLLGTNLTSTMLSSTFSRMK